ncbi:MAG TPA: sulfurtransferase [Spirochaetia bacterium]|nr:sulfurtransferase [Spirochaetia bacterium]
MRRAFVLMSVALLALGRVAAQPAAPSGLAHPEFLVSPQELQGELTTPRLLILDVREPTAYLSGHIPGAVNLPLSELQHSVDLSNGNVSPAIVKPAGQIRGPFRAAGIERDSRIVLYDAGETYSATRVWWMLDYYGHLHIAVQNGGLAAWKAMGGELATNQVHLRRGRFEPVADASKIATFAYVESHMGTSATSICDALSADSYAAGAIPGSISLPWSDTLTTNAFGGFKEANQLASLLESAGLKRDSQIIFYCQRGYVSSVEYFVARALGYQHVRLYDGSLSDFTARGGRLQPSGGS